MSLQTELVRIAAAEVGVREVGGNNIGPRIADYQRATFLAPGAWPWCAAFCCWVLNQALMTSAGKAFAGNQDPGIWRSKEPGAFKWIEWATRRGLLVFDENSRVAPLPGDFVVFDFSHIGLVEAPLYSTGRVTDIKTIEGNTNGAGDRDSASGDGVWRKVRSTRLVRSYIRLPEKL